MKKMLSLILSIILILCFTGLITAMTLQMNDIKVDSENYTRLSDVDSLTITSTPLRCDSEVCDSVSIKTGYGRTTWKPQPYWENCTEIINDSCTAYERVYYSAEEMTAKLEIKKKQLKDRILERLIIDEESEEKLIIIEDTITQIKQK